MMILHLTTQTAWNIAQQRGEYRAESLVVEGFIHCSTSEQILGVANRFYRDVPELVLLWIDPARIPAEVRWEAPVHPAKAGDTEDVAHASELFPHVYGPIPLDAVIRVEDFRPDQDGIFRDNLNSSNKG
mgnify:CR=1 FL=1